jgi:hypothetical protein
VKLFIKILFGAILLLISLIIWLPVMHFVFKPDTSHYLPDTGVGIKSRQVAENCFSYWNFSEPFKPGQLARYEQNPEWNFMSRTYMVLGLADMGLREPDKATLFCQMIDKIIDDTLFLEKQLGQQCFLLDYGKGSRAWVNNSSRSIFVDGEIALMIAARRTVAEKKEYQSELLSRVAIMIEQMQQSPVLCAESYPNECWIFCNTIALAAIRLSDRLDHADHSAFISQWIHRAKNSLIDSKTGLLISAFTVDGQPAHCGRGPEGSSIWMACHMLQIIDPVFAQDQYTRAKKELSGSLLRFGYSREWPRAFSGSLDIDSGPVVPWCGASPSASGLALIASASFDDRDYFSSLVTSLNGFAFPQNSRDGLNYQLSNPVGNCVVFAAFNTGPLWKKIRELNP